MDQIWSDYHFLMFLRILVRINAKEFSENFREMNLGFSRTILYGNLADNNDNRKATKQGLVLRWQKNKGDRIFFSGKVAFWGIADGGSGASEGRQGRGESNLICLSPGVSQPFKINKLTSSHHFSPNLDCNLVTHSVPLRFFAKFLASVTSGWKSDRTDQTSLCFKIASGI